MPIVVCSSALVFKAVHAFARYGTYVAVVAELLLAGWRARRHQRPASCEQAGLGLGEAWLAGAILRL